MKKLYFVEIGKQYDDLECIDIKPIKNACTLYKMKCLKCGRIKYMTGPAIYIHNGTSHKVCGKGLKTKDPIFYDRWQAMRTRTTNPNYEHSDRYLGRGIDSEPFKYFIDFYDTMYESFIKMSSKIGKNNTSLERIDNNKGYSKENCKWIDKRTQQQNTSRCVIFKAIYPDGHIEHGKCLSKFALKNNLNKSALQAAMENKRKYKDFFIEKLN